MGAEARSVVVRLSMETAQAMRASKEFGAEVDRSMSQAEKSTKRSTKALDDLGSKGGKAALVAAAGLAFLAKTAVDFESQFAGVEKTVDGTTSQLSALEGELRGLATTMPATHEEILGVAEAAGQLGVAREDITSFTETMVQLGETTNLTAQDAATDIAQIANVMGTGVEDVDNFGAALVALGNDGASTEAQILGMAQRIAGAGAQIGLAESDILAIANAASSMGIEVEAGGSAISRVFTELAKATAQGGPKLEQFAEIAGLTTDEFTRLFETDPARAFEAFTSGLDRVNKSGGDVFTTLDQLGLADVRVSQALLGMAASGDLLSDSLDLGAKAFEENTALTDEYAKRLDTTAADARIAWNQIKDAGIEAGAVLLPILSKGAGIVGDLASAFGALPDPAQNALTAMLAITALLGGGLWFGAKVLGGISSTKSSLVDLGVTAGTTKTALAGIGKGIQFALILGGINLIDDKLSELFNTKFDESSLTRNLDALSNGEVLDNLDEIGYKVANMNATFLQATDKAFGWLPGKTDVDAAKEEIDKIDKALAALVESGNGDKAAAIFDEIVKQARDEGVAMDEIVDSFGDYETAVNNAEAATPGFTDKLLALGLAAGVDGAQAAQANAAAWDEVVRSTAAGGDAAADTVGDINALTQAMRDETSAALGAFDAVSQWGAAVIAAREQVKTGEKGINEFTEAGQHNRTVLSGLASSWNEMPKSVKNSQQAYENHRRTFIDFAVQLGIGRKAARGMADDLLEVPRKTVAEIDADDRQARNAIDDTERGLLNISETRAQAIIDADNAPVINAINETKRLLGLIPDESVYINIQRRGLADQGIGPGRLITPASGGHVRGPGTSTSDSIPARLSDNEYVMKAAAVDKYGVNMMHDINSMRFASGGLASYHARSYARDNDPMSDTSGLRQPINERAHIDNLLEILNIQSGIRDLKKSLGADGKDKLEGIKRRIAELELKRAEKELKLARNAEEREQREKARDAMRQSRDDLRGVGLSFDSLVPDNRPVTVAGGVRDEIGSFRRDIIAAGGKWSKSLQRWATELIATAAELDKINAQIVAETAARDQLVAKLDDQQAALDDLTSTMESFSDQIASSLTTNPFNQSGDGAASPELAAAQAELAAIRASATGDSIAAAAQASNLIALIARLGGSSSNGAGGLAAFDATVAANTKAARDMARALQTLQDKGLDTTGDMAGLFEELARSGDLATATQLAELSAAEIDAREKAFAESQRAAAETAAAFTQARYGSDHAELVAQVSDTTAAIASVDVTLASLQATADALGEDVRAGAEAGVAALQPQIEKLTQAITQLPRKLAEAAKKDRS